MKTFKVNANYEIVCNYEKTRNGFKHTAKLNSHVLIHKKPYYNLIMETKVCYLNRTWESFEYETVIKNLLDLNKDLIPKGTQTRFLNKVSGKVKKEIQAQFKTVSMVAQFAEILCENQTEKNDWKKRMLLAGLPELQLPDDWNELNENEKETRLNNVINELKKI